MSGGRLPKRIVFGNLEGAVRRGRGGKEKEWTDCVQSEIRAFGIAGDWKATALKVEVWVETATEGGRRFMAAWRKGEVDAARHRQEREEQRDRETLYSIANDFSPIFPFVLCVYFLHLFWTSRSLDVPAGVTQEEGHTGFIIRLPSAV